MEKIINKNIKKLFEGRIDEQIEVFKIFEKNLKRREELKIEKI